MKILVRDEMVGVHEPYPTAAPEDIGYLIGLLNQVYPISDALKAEFYRHVVAFQLPKDEILVKQGDTCRYMYFIKSGAIMAYSIHNLKKVTTYISVENEFVSSINGLHGAAPAMETMVAVEDTTLMAMHNDVMQSLFEVYFDFNYLFRVMVEKYYRDAQERSHIIRIGNASERYAYFIHTKPGYIERLPAACVASFLDIKPATLFRIKKQFEAAASPKAATAGLCRQIDAYMQQHTPYTDKHINLSSLAADLKLTAPTLSVLLNNHYHLSFNDFINTHRINRIKTQMASPGSLKNFTIEAMASEVGFASRSAFYNAFKKLAGTSPLQYAQSLAGGSPVL
jgi:AraC-like DNA-binding protein